MEHIAVLLTCFNRKDKTISALTSLTNARDAFLNDLKMTIYLTDDGSTDGTADVVKDKFPKVKILCGSGSLYWAGGMRNSWREALKDNYDAYLLLNDDTNVNISLFKQITITDKYCKNKFGCEGIYIGATIDTKTKDVTYGGSLFVNRFLATMKMLPINNDSPQKCELGNANIMLVPKSVVDQIGILSEGYVHGMADYDYTMKALKLNIPSLVIPGVSGECVNDHSNPYLKLMKLGFKDRVKMLYHPVGLDFKSQIFHMKKHFPIRFPLFYLAGWFKVLFPKLYYSLFYKNRVDVSQH